MMFSVITRDRQTRGPGLIFIEEYFIGWRLGSGQQCTVYTAIIRGVTGIVCLLSKCFSDLNGTHGDTGIKDVS